MPSHGTGVFKETLLPSKMASTVASSATSNSKLLESRPSSKTRLLHHAAAASGSAPALEAAMAAAAAAKNGSSPSKHSSPVKSKRSKTFLEKRRPSFDSSGSSSSSDGSSSSSSSTPSVMALNNLETLAKQVANLELELKTKNEKLETATERLSDRELEISILQKRLELRSARLKSELAKEKCNGCAKKDGLISTLFEKVNLYETAITGVTSSSSGSRDYDISHWDLELIVRNISELNKLVAENVRTVDYVENGAKFLPTNVMHLTFYADGIRLDDGRFRPFTERGTKSFMKDLTDGFFPSELQVSFSLYRTFFQPYLSILIGNRSTIFGMSIFNSFL